MVQLEGDIRNLRVRNCLIGPLVGWVQAVPLAELTALFYYLTFAIDMAGLIFFSDCEWVVEGIAKGPHANSRSGHLHADMWRAVWKLWDRRTHPIAVKKVKAHQKKNGNIEEDVHCEGNSHADAAAKAGLEMHPIDMTAVNLARKIRAIQKRVAKLLVHMQLAVASAGDDCIKLDRRFKPKKQDMSGDAATPSSPCIKESSLRHAAVQTCSGVRCIWCNVGAKNRIALARHPCVQSPNHTL